jgi:hypothetical protein
LKIYVACDSSGSTSGPTQNVTTTPANPGSILEFTYQQQGGIRYTNNSIVEELNDKTIDVYPNPARTYIIVYNYKDAIGRKIEMFDLNGKIVSKTKVSALATRIETNKMSNGLYILKVSDAKGKSIRTEKVVIIK